MNCKHWTSCGVKHGGCCALGLYGGKPSLGTCVICPQRDADWRERVTGVRDFDCPHGVTADNIPSTGLGDTIAKITKSVGIKPCGGCKKRQAKLNKILPYK